MWRGIKIKHPVLAVLIGVAQASVLGPVASATAVPPTISDQWVSGVTPTDATLNAEINPNGLLTKYKLQLDTTGRFRFFQSDSCPLHPPGIGCAQVIISGDPLPPGLKQPVEYTLPPSFDSQHVSVNMASIGATLQPATTYYYRAIAANSVSFVYGWTQTFTTPPADLPAIVEIDSLSLSLLKAGESSGLTWRANENGVFELRAGGDDCETGAVIYTGEYVSQSAAVLSNIAATDLEEGVNTLRLCLTDAAGNRSQATTTIVRDTTPPDTAISVKPAALVNVAAASFEFSGDDAGGSGISSFQCRRDSGDESAWQVCGSPREYSGLGEGSHTFEVRVIDEAGNVDDSPATHTWTIDLPGPVSIERQWATNITPTDATLNAEINPNGQQTPYELQIDTTGSFKFFQPSSCPLRFAPFVCAAVIVPGESLPPGLVQPPEFMLPAGNVGQHVSVNMGSIGALLQPETTYYYRALAANSFGFVYGPTQTFVTPPASTLIGDLMPPDESPTRPEDGEPVTTAGSGATADVPAINDVGNGVRQRSRRAGCKVRHGWRAMRRVVRESSSRARVRTRGRARAGRARISAWLSPPPISERVPPYSPPSSERGEPESPDETSPNTTVSRRISRTQFAKFFFLSSEPDTEFRCRLDGKPFAACKSPKPYKNLKSGRHTFKVIAIDSFGNADPTPAIDSFKIPKPRSR